MRACFQETHCRGEGRLAPGEGMAAGQVPGKRSRDRYEAAWDVAEGGEGWGSHLLNPPVWRRTPHGKDERCGAAETPLSCSIWDLLALVPGEMTFIYLGWIAPCLDTCLDSRVPGIRKAEEKKLKKRKSQAGGHHSPTCGRMQRASECPSTWVCVDAKASPWMVVSHAAMYGMAVTTLHLCLRRKIIQSRWLCFSRCFQPLMSFDVPSHYALPVPVLFSSPSSSVRGCGSSQELRLQHTPEAGQLGHVPQFGALSAAFPAISRRALRAGGLGRAPWYIAGRTLCTLM